MKTINKSKLIMIIVFSVMEVIVLLCGYNAIVHSKGVFPLFGKPKYVYKRLEWKDIEQPVELYTLNENTKLFKNITYLSVNISDENAEYLDGTSVNNLTICDNYCNKWYHINNVNSLEMLFIHPKMSGKGKGSIEGNLDFFKDNKSIKTLWINMCQLTDITPIGEMEQLEDLDLYRNCITDVSVLSSLSNLKSLYI